ncbi:MAG TPA: methyl-accepting chemotaxis protein [Symbiobacteriaceae bacterium]|jgi:methyl-accepting chemotaxis protein
MLMRVRVSIFVKLLVGFAGLILLLGGVGLMAIRSVNQIRVQLHTVQLGQGQAEKLTRIVGLTYRQASDLRGYHVYSDDALIRDYLAAGQEIGTALESLIDTPSGEQGHGEFQQLKQYIADYSDLGVKALEAMRSGDRDGALLILNNRAMPKLSQAVNLATQLAKGHTDAVATGLVATDTAADKNQRWLLITGAGVSILGLIFSLVMAGALTRPIRNLAAMARAVAEGDLTVSELKIRANDETGDVTRTFNLMVRNLRDLIVRVSSSSRAVAESAESLNETTGQVAVSAQGVSDIVMQVAQGAATQVQSVQEVLETVSQLQAALQQVAAGSRDQAGSAQESTVTISRMLGAIEEMASRARGVEASSQRALDTARTGGGVVEETARGMEGIREAVQVTAQQVALLGRLGDQIGAITQAITEIADQTNLLALNAAIEAARAGDHGRGFAVVADEVRKLAERAGQSAHEIAGLIGSIQAGTAKAVSTMAQMGSQANQGVGLVGETRRAFSEILAVVTETTREAQAIAAATHKLDEYSTQVAEAASVVTAATHQSTTSTGLIAAGSQQVTDAIQAIASVSEENAASAEEVSAAVEEVNAQSEEIAAAAGDLDRIARDLREQVSRFKVG